MLGGGRGVIEGSSSSPAALPRKSTKAGRRSKDHGQFAQIKMDSGVKLQVRARAARGPAAWKPFNERSASYDVSKRLQEKHTYENRC